MARLREFKESLGRFWRTPSFGRSVWVACAVVGLISVWAAPNVQTLLLLAGCLVMLMLVLGLRRLGLKARLLSMRVHPGFAMMVATFFGLLLALEIILRALFSPLPDLDRVGRWATTVKYQYDPTLGWFPIPNSRAVLADCRTVSIAHNSIGFRDPEPVLDHRPRLVFLGDSFVWGFNAEASERFTEKLRQQHPDWSVFNFGVSGYGTAQEYLLLQRYFSQYQPQLVFLVYCTLNDDSDNRSNGDCTWYYRPYFIPEAGGLRLCGVPVPTSERVFHLRHPLLSKLYLARLTFQAWRNMLHPPQVMRTSPTPALLTALRQYVEAHGAAFYVGITGRDAGLEEFMRRSRIDYVDLSTDLVVSNDCHWSPEGHKFVARKIEAFLKGKFPKSP